MSRQPSPDTLKCSSCDARRPINDFPLTASGERRKSCYRHLKRQTPNDSWSSFAQALRLHRSQSEHAIDLDKTFAYDDIPVRLIASASGSAKDETDTIARIIWDLTGFRFRYHLGNQTIDGFSNLYFCCQDANQRGKSAGQGKRFSESTLASEDCHSRLKIHIKPVQRLVCIAIRHCSHRPYSDRMISPVVVEFVEARLDSTPGQIYQDAKVNLGEDAATVNQKQIYYWWQRLSSSVWKLDSDPFTSALKMAPDQSLPQTDIQLVEREGKTVGLILVVKVLVNLLRASIIELSIDATFGTNKAGHELFGVLAEVDGTGVPLLYCFMDSRELLRPGKKISLVSEALTVLKAQGTNPQFVGCDKDRAEIASIKAVWPTAKIQLCYWHVLRAIRQRLASSKATTTRGYSPQDAAETVSGLEVCWGTTKHHRHHPPQICPCVARDRTHLWDQAEKLECTKEESKIVIDLISRHFNEHTAFPTLMGTRLAALDLRKRQAQEALDVCKAHEWPRVWAYLWTNWYASEEWGLWARAANESIPVLKSTMVTESHWRVIKHDYLHRFARPRIDLVVYILRTRVIRMAVRRVTALLHGSYRAAQPAWRAEFVKAWRKNEVLDVRSGAVQQYHTSVHTWTCACNAFVMSRFLLCKHLVSLVPPTTTLELRQMERRRVPPFWTHPTLAWARPTANAPATPTATAAEPTRGGEEDVDVTAGDGDEEAAVHDVDTEEVVQQWEDDDDTRASVDDLFAQAQVMLARLTLLVEREQPYRSRAFVEHFLNTNRRNQQLLNDVESRLHAHTHPRTWVPGQHPATIYLRGSDRLA